MSNNKFQYKAFFVFAGLFTLFIISNIYWEEMTLILRNILEFEFAKFIIWSFVFLLFLCYYIFSKDKKYNLKPMIFPAFGNFWDIVVGGGSIATAIVSSITLLKGLFIQTVFTDIIYYKQFNELDLWTMALTMIFLLFFLSMKVSKIIKELFWLPKLEEITKNG